MQTGYKLVLLGRFHPAGPADLEAKAHALYERLRALALEVIGDAPPDVLLCVLPLSRGTVAAGERVAIEVELVVVASLAHPDKLPAPVATRQRIRELRGEAARDRAACEPCGLSVLSLSPAALLGCHGRLGAGEARTASASAGRIPIGRTKRMSA